MHEYSSNLLNRTVHPLSFIEKAGNQGCLEEYSVMKMVITVQKKPSTSVGCGRLLTGNKFPENESH